ncbi:hypothetical protein BGZ51_007279 [Haplosporangium sp. Z 767]|nr:hypothetical protein BGZ51_007279 [Haplosporangium sp. Z 767]KAF9179312.1 hypothetical protein BGZ50_007102 [Haplosporangium sp. Z 11]
MIKYASLLKGKWIKFWPLSEDYMETLSFQALLEGVLRSNYTVLTRGEIPSVHQDKESGFVIEEFKHEAVSAPNTDPKVDIDLLDTEMQDGSSSAAAAAANGYR